MKFIKVSNIKISIDDAEEKIWEKAMQSASVSSDEILSKKILKMSIDARDKSCIQKIFTVGFTVKKYNKKRKNVTVLDREPKYCFKQTGEEILTNRPVIVGFGPAGMFCAYLLVEYGYRPIIIERGSRVEERIRKVQDFWKNNDLDPECNVQFGEGGAGTFSDGKLNTGIRDKQNRINKVLETFVCHGADEKILYDAKPHIGTDVLSRVVKSMRETIESKGGTFYFDTALKDIVIEDDLLKQIVLSDGKVLDTQVCVLAIGHSARDTFEMLYKKELQMEAKPFAVGVRIEHLQKTINRSQYGFDGNRLGAANYKLTYHTNNDRAVYSFCMCPGGYVVNASSQPEGMVVNGMSNQARDGKNANSAMVVTVTPQDFGDDKDPLSGVRFQKQIEQLAYREGNGKIPVQRFGDFCHHEVSEGFGKIAPQTKGNTHFADINRILPEYICDALKEGISHFGSVISGFDDEDAVLSAVESRTSSPVRIKRDENYQCRYKGVFPAGEGAGYAGGITSAAIDGIKIFEFIANKYKPFC